MRAASTACSATRAAASGVRSMPAAKPQVPSWTTRTANPLSSASLAPSSSLSRTSMLASRMRSTAEVGVLGAKLPGPRSARRRRAGPGGGRGTSGRCRVPSSLSSRRVMEVADSACRPVDQPDPAAAAVLGVVGLVRTSLRGDRRCEPADQSRANAPAAANRRRASSPSPSISASTSRGRRRLPATQHRSVTSITTRVVGETGEPGSGAGRGSRHQEQVSTTQMVRGMISILSTSVGMSWATTAAACRSIAQASITLRAADHHPVRARPRSAQPPTRRRWARSRPRGRRRSRDPPRDQRPSTRASLLRSPPDGPPGHGPCRRSSRLQPPTPRAPSPAGSPRAQAGRARGQECLRRGQGQRRVQRGHRSPPVGHVCRRPARRDPTAAMPAV